jgi:hypothetical protein
MLLEPFYILHTQLQYGLLKTGLHRLPCSLQQATVHYEMMPYMSMPAALLLASKLKDMSTMHRLPASPATVGSPTQIILIITMAKWGPKLCTFTPNSTWWKLNVFSKGSFLLTSFSLV